MASLNIESSKVLSSRERFEPRIARLRSIGVQVRSMALPVVGVMAVVVDLYLWFVRCRSCTQQCNSVTHQNR